jgi:hypothetical protein
MILTHLTYLVHSLHATHQHILHAVQHHPLHPLEPRPTGGGQQQQNQQGQNQTTGQIDVATSLKNIVIELGSLFGVGLLALAILRASIMTMFAGESPGAEDRAMRAFGLAFIGFLGIVGAVGIAMAINGQVK